MASEPTSETGQNHTVSEQGIMPVTIKLVREGVSHGSENGKWKVNERIAHIIKIIGKVIQKTENTTALDFYVDDFTGTIRVKYNNSNDFDVSIDDYVCIAGNIQSEKLNPYINAHQVSLVQNLNQIPYQMLQSCLVHLQLTSDKIPNKSAYSYDTQVQNQPEPVDRMVEIFQFIKEGGDAGQTKEAIQKHFSANMSLKEIDENITKLCNNGDIYNSGDSYQPL